MCIGCKTNKESVLIIHCVFALSLLFFFVFSFSTCTISVVSHPHRDLQSVAVLVSLTWAAAGALAMCVLQSKCSPPCAVPFELHLRIPGACPPPIRGPNALSLSVSYE